MAPHCPVRIDFRSSPTRANPKCSGAEGFQRAIGKPFGRLRRGETLCNKQCNAMQNQKLIIIDFIIQILLKESCAFCSALRTSAPSRVMTR